MSENNKVENVFRGVIDRHRIEVENNNETLKQMMPAVEEHQQLCAEIRKKSYDHHIKAGFSPEQALQLCKG